MKRITLLLAIVALINIPALSHAQDEDQPRISRLVPERGTMPHITYTYNHRSAFDDAPGAAVTLHALDAGGMYPIPITNRFILGAGVKYYLHHFRLHNVTDYYNTSSINVHNIGLPLDAIFIFGEDWFLNVNFTPTLSSDLKEFSGHDFQFIGSAAAGWAFHDAASLIFGVAVSKEFWQYYPFPVLGLVVRPEGSFFDLETVLPSYIRLNFQVASFVKLFAQGEFEGFVWDMKGDGAVPNHFMKMIDTHAGAGAEFKIIDGLVIEIWGGANPYREVEYRDRTGQKFKTRQKVGFFAESGISITPELFTR